MAAKIEGVATAVSSRMARKNARRLADEAARTCLERAGVRPHELELLVNVGIYREDNLVEPALASMIQEDIGANPGHPPVEHAHGTFSFDVNDGGRGVVTAFELLDGFVASGTAATVMVVASDVIPPTANDGGVAFPPVGGAVLLRPDENHAGFVAFHAECAEPGESGVFESWVDWHEHVHRLRLLGDGKNLLEFEVGKEFSVRAVEATQNAAKTFLQRHGLQASDVDLVIPSQYPVGFPTELGRALEIAPERVVRADPALSGAHTAGSIGALERAFVDGRFRQARTILFATVGGGISVGLALYRH